MTRSASAVDTYLARLRSELSAAGAADADELVAEIRSLLTDAASDDADDATAVIARLGEPMELAQGILAERGLDVSSGISPGVWWRLGIAAPIDIAIGLALPLAAALPLYAAASFGQPRSASVAVALVLGAVVLAWPLLIWRPYMRGGSTLSPGMTLTGLAVVRAPGFRRLVPVSELEAMGLAPRRRLAISLLVALVALVLLGAGVMVAAGVGGSWIATAAMTAEISGPDVTGVPLRTQLGGVVERVYGGLMGSPSAEGSTAMRHVAPEASEALRPLSARIAKERIRRVDVGEPRRVAPGVYRVEVKESRDEDPSLRGSAGYSTFTLGQRRWLSEDGAGADWVVVGIAVGEALEKE